MLRRLLSAVRITLFSVITALPGYTPASPQPGDVAPLGAPDNALNVADLVLLGAIIQGAVTPGLEALSLSDVAPLNAPDGQLNVSDYLTLEQAVMGLVALPPPTLAIAPPLLWGNNHVSSPYYISGLTLANTTVNIYLDGVLHATAQSNGNGLFSLNVTLIPGAAHSIYARTEYAGMESKASNTLTATLQAAPLAGPDPALIDVKYNSQGGVSEIQGAAGSVPSGATVIVYYLDGTQYRFTANNDGSFRENLSSGIRIQSIAFVDATGKLSDPSIITAPGALAGTFDVDPSGAATYAIPLAVPPGTAGMTPGLSLNYSSNAGNGPLGRGWSLGGLSIITRCPQTYVQDGQPGAVRLDAADRFCLDGQRLVAVSGIYGADQTEYRTETESFARVVSYGGSGAAPDYFKVWTRQGQLIRYGFNPDSEFNPGAGNALLWAADRIEDRSGNYLAVRYLEDTLTGEHYPLRLDYTGNDAAGVLPYNSVRLVYETRPDRSSGYVGGNAVASLQRLSNIQVYDGTAMVRDYRLAYDSSPASGASRLRSILECESAASAAACLMPTRFDWSGGAAGFQPGVTSGASSSGYASAKAMDVNGDGRQDLVVPHDGSWWINYGAAAGFLPEVNTNITTTGSYPDKALVIDYNSDGMADLLVPGSDGYWDLLLAGNQGPGLVANLIPNHGYSNKPLVVDIDGDGRQDLVVLHNAGSGTTRHVYLNTASGFAAMVDTGKPKYNNNDLIIDYNNDGRLDVLNSFYRGFVNGVETCEWWLFHFDGQAFQYRLIPDATIDERGVTAGCRALNSSSNNARVGDINADGLQDLVYQWGNSEYWRLLPNTGQGLQGPLLESGLGGNGRWYAQALDYNQDGRVDYLVPGSADNRWHVYLSGYHAVQDIDSGLDSSGYQDTRVMDVNGDGMQDIVAPYNGVWNVHLRNGPVPDRLLQITSGMGTATAITYEPLTSSSVYTKGTSADPAQLELDFQAPLAVVAQSSIDDGIGGQYLTRYRYAGAKVHLQGRGLSGFRQVTAVDPQTGISTITTYRQDFPFAGMPEKSERFLNGQLISRTLNTYAELTGIPAAAGVHFPYVSQSAQTSYDLPVNGAQGAMIRSVVSTTSYDNYGNPVSTELETTDAAGQRYSKLTSNSYDPPDLNAWVLDRVSRSTIRHQSPGMPDVTRTSSFSYYAAGHPSAFLLADEIIEPDAGVDSPLYLKTTRQYDGFGNATQVTTTGLRRFNASAGTEARLTETQYDSQGRFPEWTSNALGQTEYYRHDPRSGARTRLTGPNGLVTQWSYNNFGRKIMERRADGTATSWQYDFCASNDCPHGGYIQTVSASGSAPVRQYHDALLREIRIESVSLKGETIFQDTEYDQTGNIQRKSRPYFAGVGQPQWTSFGYDVLNRPLQERSPDGGMVDYVYSGFARYTRRYHSQGDYDQYDMRVNDVMEQLVSVIDASGGTQSYVYDAAGNLVSTTDYAGNTTRTDYDLRGRKISMDDPDMGRWVYHHNAFGEQVWQLDAKGQVVMQVYDRLGRVIRRNEPEGITTWVFDTAAHGIGKLASVSAAASGPARSFRYDSLGRLASETSVIDGNNQTLAYSYDSSGRQHTVTYPTGFMVRNVYADSGPLLEVRAAANDTLYWRAEEYDAEGRATLETLGNGLQTIRQYDATSGSLQSISTGAGNGSAVQNLAYQFDALGNLKQRTDARQNLTETFVYDDLNRLRQSTLASVGSRYYDYDELGNIRKKSDFGDAYTYGANGAGPHAVTQVKNGATVLTSYSYDANGNMTGGDGRNITWTSFNKAAQITRGATSIRFTYDADHNRVKQTNGNTTTYYMNPGIHSGVNYEQEINGNVTAYRHYIHAGGRAVAIYTRQSDNTEKTRYLHTDHLGSTDAITDENGAVVERMSFATFGSRRHANWKNSTSVLDGIETHHGFTGHEHLDAVGIIHMNGRLYDPKLGRFLSPDVQIQYPDQTQSFNRYTYVNNNPLSFTDPSGYGFFSKLWKKIRGVVAVAAAIAVGYLTFGWGAVYWGSIGGAFITGATFAGFTYGLFAGGIPGAIKGGLAAYGIASAIVGLHGLSKSILAGLSSVLEKTVSMSEAIAHVTKFGLHQFSQLKTRQEMQRFAKRNGMSLFELNAGLGFVSFSGGAFFGYDRLRLDGDESFGVGKNEPGIAGIFQNGIDGIVFDAADVALTFQGLPTAQGLSLVGRCGGRVSGACLGGNYKGNLYGHSQGAAEISVLKGLGLIDKSVGLQVFSLPFTRIAPAGVEVSQGSRDLANMGFFGHIMNFGSELVGQNGFGVRDAFRFRPHSCQDAYPGCAF